MLHIRKKINSSLEQVMNCKHRPLKSAPARRETRFGGHPFTVNLYPKKATLFFLLSFLTLTAQCCSFLNYVLAWYLYEALCVSVRWSTKGAVIPQSALADSGRAGG